MQKSSWKYKRIVNQLFFHLRHTPLLAVLAKRLIYVVRLALRKGQPPSCDLAVEKIYSNSNQYLYVANPKVATRSMIDYLQRFDGQHVKIDHQSLAQFIDTHSQVNGFYRFSFVRNPWARCYSCWLDKITNQHKFCDMTIISRYKGLYPDMSFDAFVSWLASAEGQDDKADRHWMSQCQLLGGSEQIGKYDFIGRLENIEADFLRLSQRLNIGPQHLEELNLNQKNPLSYQDKYTAQTKALIATRYEKDIKTFSYSF